MIDAIEEKLNELAIERGIDLTIKPEVKEEHKPVGYLYFADSGEVMAFYSADKMLASYSREIESIGPENVRFCDIADKDLEDKLYAAYVGEYGIDTGELETPKEATPDLSLPDPAVTETERNEYGYSYDGMLPVTTTRAIELFGNGNPIYLLYPDNTEVMVLDADEIKIHGGLCGIEVDDWERIRAAENPIMSESTLEAELLHGGKNLYGIYQIKDAIEEPHNFRFAPMRELEALGLSVDRSNYELVYTGELPIRDTQTNLQKLFEVFQHDSPECPSDFTYPSMSVSDVIVIQRRGNVSAHYVDSAGFKELSSFTGSEFERQPTLSQVETKWVHKQDPPTKKPANKAAPTLLDELAEAKLLVNRGGLQTAKHNEPEV
ncbi:hypothetical protein FACS1894127_7690 [Clostridia bacterium]|nr:hypothetical protein FACS1894127_7690 [Clostridia bacterium]